MKQTWSICLFQVLGYALVALCLLGLYDSMLSPSWITLPDDFLIYLAVVMSGYALLRHKVIPDTEQPKPNRLAQAAFLIILAGILLSGLYQLLSSG